MGNRNKERLQQLNTALKPGEAGESATQATSAGVRSLLKRDNTLAKVASGDRRTVNYLQHPTERIRMWANHNRDYSLLSVERCADLIDGFTRTGAQEFPAIVRKVSDDAAFDFEVICGARRHWTAAHLGWPLLVEVRELNDRQAFILQDLENRDREDISDYERALDYRQALPKFFDNNRAQMAQFLEIDKANFHRLLELAELPKGIVTAYADLRDLKVHHGTAYRRALADPKTKRRLLDAAKRVREQRLAGPKVFSALKKAIAAPSPKPPSAVDRRYGNLQAHRVGDRPIVQIQLSFSTTDYGQLAPGTAAGLRDDFNALINDLESGKL